MIHPDERKIWWFASYPKSGSTWLRMFVNAYITGFPLDINSPFQFAINDLTSQVIQITCARPINKLTLEEQAYFRPAALMNFLNIYAAKDMALKTHHAKIAINDIQVCPHQLSRGAIYIIRDPRDVAISFSDHVGESIDNVIDYMSNVKFVLKNVDNLYHVLLTWSEHVRSWTRENSNIITLVIRYEDLLSNPFETFGKVIEFLGHKIEKKRLQFAINETKFTKLRAVEDKDGFNEVSKISKSGKFFRVGKEGQWREILTQKQIARIERDHGEIMKRFGYELVTNVELMSA